MAAIRQPLSKTAFQREHALGQYMTPLWVAEALVARHFPDLDDEDVVVEPSCGRGSFLRAIPPHVRACGVEIDPALGEQARLMSGRPVIIGDFNTVALDFQPTVMLGNPPFNMAVIEGFLDRAHHLLPSGGRVGFVLPSYAMQTPRRVCRWSERWSLLQEMIPRSVYPYHLSTPLIWALFSKDSRRAMVGFALYGEARSVESLDSEYRAALTDGAGSMWSRLCHIALRRLGGEARLAQLYAELRGKHPSTNHNPEAKIRQTLRAYPKLFRALSEGHYALA